ncbi:MAG: hypothetical protein V1755_05545 [Chloroflexota bacterium]
MFKIKSEMPTAIQIRPRKRWWSDVISYWRTLRRDRKEEVSRQEVFDDLIQRGLASAKAEQAAKKR